MKSICRKRRGTCSSILCFVCVLILSTTALEWIVDDAVYITSQAESDVETRNPDEDDNRPAHREALPGKCLKFKDCYPTFFLTDVKKGRPLASSISSSLVDFVFKTVKRCKPSQRDDSDTASKVDTYIWCRLRTSTVHNHTNSISFSPEPQSTSTTETVIIEAAKYAKNDNPTGPGKASEERVVGGKEVEPGQVPYTVAITYEGKQVCGASIIDERHVLTAAHCVSHLDSDELLDLRLLIGDHDIMDPSDTDHQERNVSTVIYHKEFASDTFHDDIALIKLAAPVDYTNTVSNIPLTDGSQTYDDGNTIGKLVGWGNLEDSGERSNTPRIATLRIWKPEECEEIYDGIIPEDVLERAFCAGGLDDGGTDACNGDSGGPFTVKNFEKNKIEQYGIVSFGVNCGEYPAIFTKVSEYMSWIDRHMNGKRLKIKY